MDNSKFQWISKGKLWIKSAKMCISLVDKSEFENAVAIGVLGLEGIFKELSTE